MNSPAHAVSLRFRRNQLAPCSACLDAGRVESFHDIFARYGHPKFKSAPLILAIIVSWGIAFFEYCLAVPANRIGSAVYSTAELKMLQKVITLLAFGGFSVFWLKESLTVNHLIGFALIATGAAFVFRG